jgi:hypothetical protein
MTAVSYDLCSPWATPSDVGGDCCAGTVDPALMDDALAGASLILYNLTGKQWPGLCTDVIRPTAEHAPDLLRPGWVPYGGYSGPWAGGSGSYAYGYNFWAGMWGACTCNRTTVCGLHAVSEIVLPGYPVAAITTVKIDGVTRAPAGYKIQDRQRLVYVPQASDTAAGWPCCQSVELPSTAVGTWEVTYTWGAAPPAIGARFAATLACQLYKTIAPDDASREGCRLPQRITSITRQGVTLAVLDSFQVFKDGLTGLPEIDLWISSDRRARTGAHADVITPGMVASLRRDQP